MVTELDDGSKVMFQIPQIIWCVSFVSEMEHFPASLLIGAGAVVVSEHLENANSIMDIMDSVRMHIKSFTSDSPFPNTRSVGVRYII